jgi:transposase
MMSEATQINTNGDGAVLYMAMELAERTWKLLFATTAGRRRERSIPARDLGRLFEEIAAAKRRFGLPAQAREVSCYEAGREGFWLDRALRANGIENLVVDSSSIEVPRRARRRKTDRLDLGKLMALLLRWAAGERKAWSVVRVPSPEAEDVRQLSRAIERLKAERGAHRARIQSLLATQGLRLVCIGGRKWAERVPRCGPGMAGPWGPACNATWCWRVSDSLSSRLTSRS